MKVLKPTQQADTGSNCSAQAVLSENCELWKWKKHKIKKVKVSKPTQVAVVQHRQRCLLLEQVCSLTFRQSPDLWNDNNKPFPSKTCVVWNYKQKWMFYQRQWIVLLCHAIRGRRRRHPDAPDLIPCSSTIIYFHPKSDTFSDPFHLFSSIFRSISPIFIHFQIPKWETRVLLEEVLPPELISRWGQNQLFTNIFIWYHIYIYMLCRWRCLWYGTGGEQHQVWADLEPRWEVWPRVQLLRLAGFLAIGIFWDTGRKLLAGFLSIGIWRIYSPDGQKALSVIMMPNTGDRRQDRWRPWTSGNNSTFCQWKVLNISS